MRFIHATYIFGLVLLFPFNTRAAVIIQSVEPGSPTAADEYITLYNPDSVPQNLSGWSIQVKSDSGSTVQKKNFASDMHIPAQSSVLVANNSGIYAAKSLMTYASFSLPENGATIVVAPTTTLLASFPNSPNAVIYHYDSSQKNSAAPENQPVSTSVNSSTSAVSASPDVFVTPKETPPYPVQISEIFPHPADYKNEFIELYNPNPAAISIGGYILQDASGNSYIMGTRRESTTLMPQEFRSWPRSITNISLNDTDGEEIILSTAKKTLLDQVTYHGSPPKNASFALLRGGWHWTNTPSPNSTNMFDELPKPPRTRAVIPAGPLFVGEELQCSAEDTVDPNDDIKKYLWNFGDGFEVEGVVATHTYATTGTFAVQFTAIDSHGASSTVSRSITVKMRPQIQPSASSSTIFAAAKLESDNTFTYASSSTAVDRVKQPPRNTTPQQRTTNYSGVVAVAPHLLGARTLVVGKRTVIFTTERPVLTKLTPGTHVRFSAREKFRSNRLVLEVTKNDVFKIVGEGLTPTADIISGEIKSVSRASALISTSSTEFLLPTKNMPLVIPELHAGDGIEIAGIILEDDAAAPLIIPTEKISVQPRKKSVGAQNTQGILLMYGSGLLLIMLYFVFTQKRVAQLSAVLLRFFQQKPKTE